MLAPQNRISLAFFAYSFRSPSLGDDGDDLDQPKNYPTGCPLVFPSKPIADSGAKSKN
jgi:hypothetical protein